MLNFNQFNEEKDFAPMDISKVAKGATKYSHGPNHQGVVDKTGKAGIDHKTVHDAATKSGYKYTKKSDNMSGMEGKTAHMYSKSGGPFTDHNMTVWTKTGSGQVTQIDHSTRKDNS